MLFEVFMVDPNLSDEAIQTASIIGTGTSIGTFLPRESLWNPYGTPAGDSGAIRTGSANPN